MMLKYIIEANQFYWLARKRLRRNFTGKWKNYKFRVACGTQFVKFLVNMLLGYIGFFDDIWIFATKYIFGVIISVTVGLNRELWNINFLLSNLGYTVETEVFLFIISMIHIMMILYDLVDCHPTVQVQFQSSQYIVSNYRTM